MDIKTALINAYAVEIDKELHTIVGTNPDAMVADDSDYCVVVEDFEGEEFILNFNEIKDMVHAGSLEFFTLNRVEITEA